MTESLKWVIRKRSAHFFLTVEDFSKSCLRKVIDFEVIIIRNLSKINNIKYQTEPNFFVRIFFVALNRDNLFFEKLLN